MGDLQVAHYERTIRTYARGRLVDLGCGNAPLAGIYREFVENYVWADWGSSMHREVQLDWAIDLNEPLPFANEEFDTVLLTDVLEHIARPDHLLAEMVRSLKQGGHLIVGVPFFYWIHEEPHDFHRYTRYKLEHFGAINDVEVVEIREIGGAIDVWTDLTGKIVGAVWRPLARIPYHAWVALRLLPFMRRINDKSSKWFPLGYIAVYRKR